MSEDTTQDLGQEVPQDNQAELEQGAPAPVAEIESDTPTDDEANKPPKGVQKRLNELTREKYEERRRADQLQQLLEQQQALLAKAFGGNGQPGKDPNGRPDPDDFDQGRYDPGYVEALAGWKAQEIAKQQFEGYRTAELERNQTQQAELRKQSFAADERAFSAATPDYADIREALLLDPVVSNSESIGLAIIESDSPAALLYHLGNNLEEARKIAGMTPVQAARHIGRLEAQLSVKSKPVSKAPAPVRPLSGGDSVRNTSSEAGSMDDYIKARRAEGAHWAPRTK